MREAMAPNCSKIRMRSSGLIAARLAYQACRAPRVICALRGPLRPRSRGWRDTAPAAGEPTGSSACDPLPETGLKRAEVNPTRVVADHDLAVDEGVRRKCPSCSHELGEPLAKVAGVATQELRLALRPWPEQSTHPSSFGSYRHCWPEGKRESSCASIGAYTWSSKAPQHR